MTRLIDANKVIRRFQFISDTVGAIRGDGKCFFEAAMALKIIDEAPTVDAVEVVRCENCKWFVPDKYLNHEEYPNQIEADGLCIDTDRYTDCNDYCSHGEIVKINMN